MRTAASALDTGAFVMGRMTETTRLRRERDVIRRTARAAYAAAGGGSSAPGEWVSNAHRVTWVRDDCVVKVPRSAYGEVALRRDLEVRAAIHAGPPWDAWRRLVAATLVEHRTGDKFAVVEERLPGLPLVGLTHDETVMARLRDELEELREATSHDVAADDRVAAWFLVPAATVAALLHRRGHREEARSVTRWASEMARSLEGSTCRASLVHGDLWPGNILLGPDGRPGVIDWDQASFHDVALHDLLHLTLFPVCHERRVDLGQLIRRLLVARDDEPELVAAVRRSGVGTVLDDAGVAERDALIWYWLRHVDRMIREPGHATNPRWVRNNVVAVAATIHQGRRTT